jgi:hypothetical protein
MQVLRLSQRRLTVLKSSAVTRSWLVRVVVYCRSHFQLFSYWKVTHLIHWEVKKQVQRNVGSLNLTKSNVTLSNLMYTINNIHYVQEYMWVRLQLIEPYRHSWCYISLGLITLRHFCACFLLFYIYSVLYCNTKRGGTGSKKKSLANTLVLIYCGFRISPSHRSYNHSHGHRGHG